MTGARVLLVEDERHMQRSIELILNREGYVVALADTGEDAISTFVGAPPDIVLLDLMLPDMDGLDVCRSIREHADTPVVVLSAKGDEPTKVQALDLGADDYLTKPFGAQELLARVRVALRHASGTAAGGFRAGRLSIDLSRRVVTLGGADVALTPREFDVLSFFVVHHDRVLTHATLLRNVWGPAYAAETQYLRNVVLSLRRKLEEDPSRPRLFVTEPGIGYRLRTEG